MRPATILIRRPQATFNDTRNCTPIIYRSPTTFLTSPPPPPQIPPNGVDAGGRTTEVAAAPDVLPGAGKTVWICDCDPMVDVAFRFATPLPALAAAATAFRQADDGFRSV